MLKQKTLAPVSSKVKTAARDIVAKVGRHLLELYSVKLMENKLD
jgi:hypothetical protein